MASVDLSGPHLATPMPGCRIGQASAKYFVVLMVRPDVSGGRRYISCQTDVDDAGPVPVADTAASNPSLQATIATISQVCPATNVKLQRNLNI